LYSGAAFALADASQANSKHFFTGQKNSLERKKQFKDFLSL